MKVTEENIKDIPTISDSEKSILRTLLLDLEHSKLDLELHYQDWHDEYSPERTDSCPDYYGTFTIRRVDNGESIGVEMDLKELDGTMCFLVELMEYLLDF